MECSDRLRDFDRPALVVCLGDRRPAHATRARFPSDGTSPQGHLVEIAESSTLVPEDQPERLAEALTRFLTLTGAEPVR